MRTALVTGGSSGLGMYAAQALAQSGWCVLSGARSFPKVPVCEGNLTKCHLDVTDSQSVHAFVSYAVNAWGRIDVLITAAGQLIWGACEEIDAEFLRRVMATNFEGAANVIRETLEPMRLAGKGKILCFSSINGLLGIPFQSAYTASKHALEGYCECLAMECRDFGIEICLVEPGDHQGGSNRCRHLTDNPIKVYDYARGKAVDRISRDEHNGSDPVIFGKKIVRLLNKRRLPFRCVIAKWDQRLIAKLSDWIPAKAVQMLLSLYYVGRR